MAGMVGEARTGAAVELVERFAAERIAWWRDRPDVFVREVWPGTVPDSWQANVLQLFPRSPRIALKACVGPGKTCVLAWLIWNFLATRPHPRIVATSITKENLRDNLWAELQKWQAQSPLLQAAFSWSMTAVRSKQHPGTWWCSARTWSRTADPEQQALTLSGLHADYCMAVADESGGMPGAVVASGEGVLSSGVEGHLVQAGNPTHLVGPLHDAATKDRAQWVVIEITGDPDDPQRAPRVDREWALLMRTRWGPDSAWYRSKVAGKFPRKGSDRLIALDQVEDACGRTLAYDGSKLVSGLRTLGVDVARLGDDRTVVLFRDGEFGRSWRGWTGQRTTYTATMVHELATQHQVEEVRVDDIGVGGGVTDQLLAKRRAYRVVPVNVAEAATEKDRMGRARFENLRAQMGFAVQEVFRSGRIGLPANTASATTLVQEATDIKYGTGRGGKVLRLESKDDYRKRHNGQSPDYWDALVLAFADPGTPHRGLQDWTRQQAQRAAARAAA